jgi:glyceraldehyde 3-phosphate dehydrogenase
MSNHQEPRGIKSQGEKSSLKLGVNGLGRIGKLSVWHHAARGYFSELVIKIGREAGRGLEDVDSYIERDSTYGYLGQYLYGHKAGRVIENLNEENGTFALNGILVTILRKDRNPKDIPWRSLGVHLVVDATGKFLDPAAPPDHKNGSIQGHPQAGAKKVIVSAPFKIKDKAVSMPDNASTLVIGINDEQYDPQQHRMISAASCTTTCLAFMVKTLLDYFGADKILSASTVTVHPATGSQEMLDGLPDPKSKDLRKNRSIMNNIILTSTEAAQALALVIPEMKRIRFIAEAVRIPTSTGSLIVLVMNIQDESLVHPINRETINQVYRKASETHMSKYLLYTGPKMSLRTSSEPLPLRRSKKSAEIGNEWARQDRETFCLAPCGQDIFLRIGDQHRSGSRRGSGRCSRGLNPVSIIFWLLEREGAE